MNDSIDAQPLFGPPSRPSTTSRAAGGHAPLDGLTGEFDLSEISWLTAEDGLQILDEPQKSTSRTEPPPPPSSRPRSEVQPFPDAIGGAAAPNAPEKAPRSVTTPKPKVASPALPRVVLNHPPRYLGVTQPRESTSVPSDEIIVDPGLLRASEGAGKKRGRAIAIAGGVIAAIAATTGVVAFLRLRPTAALPPARSFLAEAPSSPSASLPVSLPSSSAPAPPGAAQPLAEAPASSPLPTVPPVPVVPSEVALGAPNGSSLALAPSLPSSSPSASPPVSLPPSSAPAPPGAAPPLAKAAASSPPPTVPPAPAVPPEVVQDASNGSVPALAPTSATHSAADHPPATHKIGAVGKEQSAEPPAPALGSRSTKHGSHPTRASVAPRSSTAQAVDRTESGSVTAPVDPLTTYTYQSSVLFAVATEPKRVTDVTLQAGERLVAHPTAGDASLWVITVVDGVQHGQPQQHVYIKPLRPDVSTSLTLATDRRNYHLELTSSATGQYMAAVQWRYPEDEAERRRQEIDRATTEHLTTTRIADAKALRFNYSIRVRAGGEPAWKPTMVFDDGVQTFIRFPKPVVPERAPVLLVERTGSARTAEYVNYRVRSDLYVVDRLIDTAELRLPDTDGGPDQVVRITRSAP